MVTLKTSILGFHFILSKDFTTHPIFSPLSPTITSSSFISAYCREPEHPIVKLGVP
jgi:hypothetical protein